MIGKVVSNKMEKTVVVAVETIKAHPIYQKRIKHTKRLKAHTEQELVLGTVVRIEETKPISGQTNFIVAEVIKEGKGK